MKNNKRGAGETETIIIIVVIAIMTLSGFIAGLNVSDNVWKKEVVSRQLAEYTVDATTGKTELVWKSDRTEAVASRKK